MKLSKLSKHAREAYIAHTRRVRSEVRRIFAKRSPGRPPTMGRRRVSRREVAEKTDGNCHMCGDALNSSWHIGHVKPYRLRGHCTVKNCLPICVECNRLRWVFAPSVLRFMLLFGRYAKQEIRGKNGKPTDLGEKLITLHVRKTWSKQ